MTIPYFLRHKTAATQYSGAIRDVADWSLKPIRDASSALAWHPAATLPATAVNLAANTTSAPSWLESAAEWGENKMRGSQLGRGIMAPIDYGLGALHSGMNSVRGGFRQMQGSQNSAMQYLGHFGDEVMSKNMAPNFLAASSTPGKNLTPKPPEVPPATPPQPPASTPTQATTPTAAPMPPKPLAAPLPSSTAAPKWLSPEEISKWVGAPPTIGGMAMKSRKLKYQQDFGDPFG